MVYAIRYSRRVPSGPSVRTKYSAPLRENVDVTPTLAALLKLPIPPGTFDGRSLIDLDGRAVAPTDPRPAVYYAWSDYQAVRTKRWLLRVDPPGAPGSRCHGGEATLWRLGPNGERMLVHDERRAQSLRSKLDRRLTRGAARLEEGLRTQPTEPFFVSVQHWTVADTEQITCVPIDGGVRREDLATPGWLLVRDGLVVVQGDPQPLAVTVTVPVAVIAPSDTS